MSETVGQEGRQYRISGLRGGVEYTFKIRAIQTPQTTDSSYASVASFEQSYSLLSEGVSFVAGQEAPKGVKTLRATAAPNPDLRSHYLLKLTWIIPTQVDETGGAPISNFRIQYTTEETADFTAAFATWCTTRAGPAPCVTADVGANKDGLIGLVNTLAFAVIKGTVYHFRIAALNEVGEGPWSSSTTVGTLRTPRYITAPTQPPPPTVKPMTDTSMQIDWTEYDADCLQCYETRTLNGGRPLTHIEVHMRVNEGPWFLYGDRVENIRCDADAILTKTCLFNYLLLSSFQKGLLSQKMLYMQQKRIDVYPFTMNPKGFYQFRMRASNDNMTSWSSWSETGSGTTFLPIFHNVQVSGFPHNFNGLPTPTAMSLRWYAPWELPTNMKPVGATIYLGYNAESVSIKAQASVTVAQSELSAWSVPGSFLTI